MKKYLLGIIFVAALSCSKSDDDNDPGVPCGEHHSKPTYRDSNGRCYYFNENEVKEFLDEDECDC